MNTADIEKVLDEKIAAGEMFTAHDITLELRKNYRASHDQVKNAVHDYYARGGFGITYDRSSITTPTGEAYLYHKIIDDPSTYNNIRGGNNYMQVQTSVPVAIQSLSQPPAKIVNKRGSLKDRIVDNRGRLNIPSILVREYFSTGQKVYAIPQNNVVVIVENKPSDDSYTEFTVDSDNQIRITSNVLKSAGLNGNKFNIDSDDNENKIIVELAN